MIRENNITILGGSFNPIHNGHIEMAKCAARQYNLENIVFMPNKSTYYKDNDAFVSDEDRITMLKLGKCNMKLSLEINNLVNECKCHNKYILFE